MLHGLMSITLWKGTSLDTGWQPGLLHKVGADCSAHPSFC